MADINIQRKKAAPSPWLLVLLAVAVLAAAAYFFLRPDPADEPVRAAPAAQLDTLKTRPVAPVPSQSADTSAPYTARTAHTPTAPDEGADTYAALAAQAATNPAAPNYALNGLQKLTGLLVALTDRDDLRDPATAEQRDNLTSATSRLGEPDTSLRPGFVAAAGLIRAMQQKAYPELEGATNDLVRLSGQLSGRSSTAADQRLNQQFLTQAAAAVRVLSEPASASTGQ